MSRLRVVARSAEVIFDRFAQGPVIPTHGGSAVDDPQLEAAWGSWQEFAKGTPPHELPQRLRSFGVADAIIDKLIERHDRETARIIELRDPIALGRENAPKWYTGPRSGDKNWPAYEAKLLKSMGDAGAVKRIDEASDKVVAMLDHPGTKSFDAKGLVVGHVQSGKTSNFTAVVCKAADRGYRMIIVLSGVHNALRRQTQARMIQDLVSSNPELWHQLTGLDRDFRPTENAASLLASRDQHLLLVIKKNSAPLTKLRKWLATAQPPLENCPTLVIDDEADQAQWREECERVPAGTFGRESIAWKAVRPRLDDVVARTRIVRDHYRSDDRLDYDSGPVTVIAVGGNTLSRGLTLEGLVVSVFVRSADVYDTLMQMGRWFGYRRRYEDMPRIWMPAEMRQWFKHLASVEAEMRIEVERYLVEHKSPLDLAVRIRCHPKMRVTAPSRMKDAVRAAASYGGQLVETRYFDTGLDAAGREAAATVHRRNAAAVDALLVQAKQQGRTDSEPTTEPVSRVLYRSVPTSAVLEFVRDYEVNQQSTEYSGDLVSQYVTRRMNSGGLLHWNVGVVAKATGGTAAVELPDGRRTFAVTRARTHDTKNSPVADIKTLTGSRDPGLDLAIPDPLPAGHKAVSRDFLRKLRTAQQRDTGLVLLYPIDGYSEPPRRPVPPAGDPPTVEPPAPKQDRAPLDAPAEVVWGMALVFPEPVAGVDVAVEYDYVQADLSNVFPASGSDEEEYDLSIFDEDLDSAATGA